MKWRELIAQIATHIYNLEDEATIRILHRDEENCVIHSSIAPISYVMGSKNCLCTEDRELETTNYLE